MKLNTIEQAIAVLKQGRPVLVMDDEDRENEGDAILAASVATAKWVGWMVRHTSGFLCAPLTEERADELDLPLMVQNNQDPRNTAYTVSVDAAADITTGISATDRAKTLRVLANPGSKPTDLRRPGHILPLRAKDGGVAERAGHTEAAIDLCRIAGMEQAAVIGELVDDQGEMLRGEAVFKLGAEANLPVITVEQLAAYREEKERVWRGAVAKLPTEYGEFLTYAYLDLKTKAEHVALVSSKGLVDQSGTTPVRVHSECITGEAFGSMRCDCGPQLQAAMESVAETGGVIVYLRGHEGRGIGLLNKMKAYRLQDQGLDTVEAQEHLGLEIDAREYGAAVAILRDLEVKRVSLMTNNPEKIAAIQQFAGSAMVVTHFNPGQSEENLDYLRTKRDRLGHRIQLDEQKPRQDEPRGRRMALAEAQQLREHSA